MDKQEKLIESFLTSTIPNSDSVINEFECTAESEIPISKSVLFRSHNHFYESWGPQAWRIIPDYISTNSFIANSYSNIIISYIKDLIMNDKITINDETNEKEPIIIWIVELGAGTGNLSYLLLRILSQLDPLYIKKNNKKYYIKLKLILTDYAQRNIDYWNENGYFKDYIENGMVDFGVYNVLKDDKIRLQHSNEILSVTTITNPVILIGNYLIDTLPNDAFSIIDQKLSEVLLNYKVGKLPDDSVFPISVLKNNKWSKRLIFPPLLYEDDDLFSAKQLKEEQERRKLEENDNPDTRHLPPEFYELLYYKEKDYKNYNIYNNILEKYRLYFKGTNASFLLPIGGFNMMDNLIKTFGNSLLLLFGDKGNINISEFEGNMPPPISIHGGSLSFMTNFHALKEYWNIIMNDNERKHSNVLLSNQSHHFKVCIFTSGLETEEILQLKSSFKQLNQFSPDDYFWLYNDVNTNAKISNIHSLLRLSCNDPSMFYRYKDILIKKLPKSSWKGEIITELLRTWGNYYHQVSSIEEDIPYSLGEVFFACDRPKDALPFFKKSLSLSGNYYSTNFHIGLCYEKLNKKRKALKYYKKCPEAELDVEDDDIKARIKYIQYQIDKEDKEIQIEEEKRKKILENFEKEKNRKNKKTIHKVIETEESNTILISNNIISRTNKYGESINNENDENDENDEEDEESDIEYDSNDDDDYLNPLCF